MYGQISTMSIFFMPQPILNKSKGLACGSSKARAYVPHNLINQNEQRAHGPNINGQNGNGLKFGSMRS